jgi:hypothetical protein
MGVAVKMNEGGCGHEWIVRFGGLGHKGRMWLLVAEKKCLETVISWVAVQFLFNKLSVPFFLAVLFGGTV